MESTSTNRSSTNRVTEEDESVFTNLDLVCAGFYTSDQNLINELIADLLPVDLWPLIGKGLHLTGRK